MNSLLKVRTAIFLLLALHLSCFNLNAESYHDCILKNMKGVSDRAAVFSIKCACRLNATPKKCRKYIEKNTPDYDPLEINVDIHEILGVRNELKECLEECMNASFFERKFGDCSID